MSIASPIQSVFRGLNNALSPCSYEYRVGMASVSDQSRIDKAGRWAEQPVLSNCSSPPGTLNSPFLITGETAAAGFAVTNVANSVVSKTDAFLNYAFRTGDKLEITITGDDSKATVGVYTIQSKTDKDTVVLTGDACSDANDTNVTLRFGHIGPHVKNLAIENTDKIIVGIDTDIIMGIGPNDYLYATKKGSGTVEYMDSSGSHADATGVSAPTQSNLTEKDGSSSRAQNGSYYYIVTKYNVTRDCESLPSAVKTADIDHDDGAKDYIQVAWSSGAATSTNRIRVYRTKRTSVTDNVFSPTNIFYFVAELTSGATYDDYMGDSDLTAEYEGRGGTIPTSVDFLIPFNNRMLYLKGNILRWSSAGRPEEVAAKYTLTYPTSDTVTNRPLLSPNTYSEAKYEITELAGQTVTGGFVRAGKCWLATAGMIGYLDSTSRLLEGYKFHVVRKGIGLINDKCITMTPYGVFGADRKGTWILDNVGRLYRLSYGVVDIKAGTGKSTALAQSDVADSFMCYLPQVEEVLWGIKQAESDLVTNGDFATDSDWTKESGWTISAGVATFTPSTPTPNEGNLYQDIEVVAGHIYRITYTITSADITFATRVIIGGTLGTSRTSTGTYTEEIVAGSTDTLLKLLMEIQVGASGSISIDNVELYDVTDGVQIVYQADRGIHVGPYNLPVVGGADFVSTGGCQAYLNDITGTGKDADEPSSPTVAQELKFWFGQSDLRAVKENVNIEIVYASITANKTVTVNSYSNKIASETGADASGNYTHNDDNLIGKVQPSGGSRMVGVKLTIPSDCAAPVLALGVSSAEAVPIGEKGER